MVLLIIIPMKNGYFIGKINPTFSDKPTDLFHATHDRVESSARKDIDKVAEM